MTFQLLPELPHFQNQLFALFGFFFIQHFLNFRLEIRGVPYGVLIFSRRTDVHRCGIERVGDELLNGVCVVAVTEGVAVELFEDGFRELFALLASSRRSLRLGFGFGA